MYDNFFSSLRRYIASCFYLFYINLQSKNVESTMVKEIGKYNSEKEKVDQHKILDKWQ